MVVTTRRQPAAVVRTAGEDRLRPLLDGTADHAIVMLGVQGMVLTWNAGAAELLGWAAEEIVGQHVSVLYPSDATVLGVPEQHLAAALAAGRHDDEGWRVRKDGTSFWAHVVTTPLRDRSGRLRGFGAVTSDQSDRLRAQDLLAVLDAAPTAILGIDPSGVVMFANDAARRLFGAASDGLAGRGVDHVLPGLVGRFRPGGRRSGLRLVGRRGGRDFPVDVSLSWATTSRGLLLTVTVDAAARIDVDAPAVVLATAASISLPPDPEPAVPAVAGAALPPA